MSVPSPTSSPKHDSYLQEALTALKESDTLEFSPREPAIEGGEEFSFTSCLGRTCYVSRQWIEDLRIEANKVYPRVLSQMGFDSENKTGPKLTAIHILVLRNLLTPK